mmetsp:Transcript_33991/g.90258  ORF Transcript_33991/g.90258 Transcript_33991/m.90258 type:complete len:218 (+) Transcript_33991:153-806(+)
MVAPRRQRVKGLPARRSAGRAVAPTFEKSRRPTGASSAAELRSRCRRRRGTPNSDPQCAAPARLTRAPHAAAPPRRSLGAYFLPFLSLLFFPLSSSDPSLADSPSESPESRAAKALAFFLAPAFLGEGLCGASSSDSSPPSSPAAPPPGAAGAGSPTLEESPSTIACEASPGQPISMGPQMTPAVHSPATFARLTSLPLTSEPSGARITFIPASTFS